VSAEVETARARPRRDRDAVAVAVERLRQMIVGGEIAPGAELSQVELGRRLGVSATPVREALRRLEAEGLVESRHNRRARVPEFDPADLDAAYASRVLLEPLALRMTVAAGDRGGLRHLRADLARMSAAARAEDVLAWECAHASFHLGLLAGCEEPLRRQIRVTISRTDRYRRISVLGGRPESWRIGEDEHRAIFDACQAGDADRAAVLLARHLDRSARAVLAILAPGWEPAALDLAMRTAEG
jgi:DNA-binding GntR family transcriptional regulator